MTLSVIVNLLWKPAMCVFKLFQIILSVEFIKGFFNFFSIKNLRFLLIMIKSLVRVRRFRKENATVVKEYHKQLKNNPDKICFYFEDQVWTIKDVEDYSNRVCSLFSRFADKGEVVALLLPNRPEYGCIWLGNAKAGIITALINTNLRMKPLLHSINVSKPKAIIYSNQYDQALSEIVNDVEGSPKLYCFEGVSTIKESGHLPDLLKSVDPDKKVERQIGLKDNVLYIYTSGTTGLPKAAYVNHSKLLGLSMAADLPVGIRDDDVVYCPLPAYHSACTALIVSAFVHKFPIILRSKFSASSYISDCIKYKATVAQYIGEMVRYIVSTPVQPGETQHRLRFITGNGVRSEIWRKFVERFKVPQIIEYYSATEGNFIIVNNRNEVGKCGYLPVEIPYWYLLGPSIVKVNEETGQPIRNKDGLCTLVEPGETGLMIGYCPTGNEMREFYGYINKKDSDARKIYNVFKMGDSAYNTGDLMVMDKGGGVSFVDRFGDTFRWKGENVSTAEVESIVNAFPAVQECAVYGVQVGSLEGKAGMTAVVMKSSDIDDLNRYLELNLPPYACPLFLRIVDSMQFTSTFKIIKKDLTKQSFDVNLVTDPLFVRLEGRYVPLTRHIYQQIQLDQLKL